MRALMFDYPPSLPQVIFRQCDDWIHFDLIFHGEIKITTPCDDGQQNRHTLIELRYFDLMACRMSSMFCSFKDLISFLEAIVCGVQECAFTWDAEDSGGSLHWARHDPTTGFVSASVWDKRVTGEYHAMLETHHFVDAVYTSFRRFVESPDYEPLSYEKLFAGDAFELVLANATLDDLAARLSGCTRSNAHRLLVALYDFVYARWQDANVPKTQTLLAFFEQALAVPLPADNTTLLIREEWNEWTAKQRRHYVIDCLFEGGLEFGCGSKLRSLRSTRIEQWLATSLQPVQ